MSCFVELHHLTFQQDNDMSLLEHHWNGMDYCVLQLVPVPQNSNQLQAPLLEEWDNISQATTDNQVMSMRRRCITLHEAYGGEKLLKFVNLD